MCCFRSTIFATMALMFMSGLLLVSCADARRHTPLVSQVTQQNNSEVVVDGGTLLVAGQPYFARIVQHNGESFDFLASLGFNTIQLAGPATDQQLREAAKANVRIICPPPSFMAVRAVSRLYQPILAWSVGNQVSANQLQLVRQKVAEIKDADKFLRPVLVHAKSHHASYAPLVGILGVGRSYIGTNRELRDYGRWIDSVTGNQLQPVWADIQTQLSKPLERQIESFAGSSLATPLQHSQIRFQMYEAISAGCRGLRFLSRRRLDASDPQTQLTAASLRWALQHAEQLQPWVAGGLIRKNTSLSKSDRDVFTLTLPGSQVLLIQRSTGFEQWACGDTPLKTIDMASVSSSTGDRAYRIDELGASLITDPNTNRGTRISIPATTVSTAVLVTADPVTVGRLNAQVSGVPVGLNQRQQLVDQALAYVQFVEQAMATTGIGYPFIGGARQQALKDLGNANQMIDRGNFPIALDLLRKADFQVALINRHLIDKQLEDRNGFFSTPLLMHPGLIPSHLQTSQNFAGTAWNPNALTGGDFENLGQMTRAGWKNRRDNQNGLTTRVELEKDAAAGGTYGLKLTVEGIHPNAGIQTTPLWIESSPVAVKKGQLIRIHGLINVNRLAAGEFEVFDSIGGQDLVVPFRSTSGWQEFTIYRSALRDGNMNLTFAVNGIGTVMVDEVTIRTLDPAGSQQQASNRASSVK